MEDDNLKKLFSSFDPMMPASDIEFMDSLEKKMDSFEMVKTEIAASRRRSYQAVFYASLTGFAVGVISAILIYFAGPDVAEWALSLTPLSGWPDVDYSYLGWCTIAAASTLTAVLSYSRYNSRPILFTKKSQG